MKINVQYMGEVRKVVARAYEEVEVSSQPTVRELLNALSERYGKAFNREVFQEDGQTPRDDLVIAVNGIGIARLDFTSTELKQTDVVTLFPIFPGGG